MLKVSDETSSERVENAIVEVEPAAEIEFRTFPFRVFSKSNQNSPRGVYVVTYIEGKFKRVL